MGRVIGPRLEWHLPEPLLAPPAFVGFDRPISTLLARRGFRDDAQLAAFLNAGSEALHDTSLMADADLALARLERALDHGERIAIWGDYDADGMTAVVVWSIALRALGAEAVRHVPSRLAEGYGLSNAGLERLAAAGVTLVVTCDCGIVNVAEVEHARSLGMDVIVTDHHLPAGALPRAVAVVDPHRPDCAYPDPDLTGAGLAYKLATALLARRGAAATDLAAMAAIGTVADLAPMTGESRAIVRLGLAEMADTRRAGLRALLTRACESPDQVTARDLAYNVAPRINAAGRIAEAELAIALLLEEDDSAAERLGDELEAVHLQRRDLTSVAIAEARAMVDGLDGTGPIALRHDNWAPGIVGLIAGRLAETLERPVAVAAPAGDELRGSVRCPVDFHAAAALETCAELLIKRGGHAAAGGFSVGDGELGPIRRRLPVAAETVPALVRRRRPSRPHHHRSRAAGGSSRLGARRPDRATGAVRTGPRRAAAGRHRVCGWAMRAGSVRTDVTSPCACCAAPRRSMPSASARPPTVRCRRRGAWWIWSATLERDTFQGQPRLRLRVVDYAASSLSPLAERRKAAQAASLQPVAMAAPAGVTTG